jgi:hypothetical protein
MLDPDLLEMLAGASTAAEWIAGATFGTLVVVKLPGAMETAARVLRAASADDIRAFRRAMRQHRASRGVVERLISSAVPVVLAALASFTLPLLLDRLIG